MWQKRNERHAVDNTHCCTSSASCGRPALAIAPEPCEGPSRHLREDKAAKDEVGRRAALDVHGYEAVRRAQAHPQLALHPFLQHAHLCLHNTIAIDVSLMSLQ